MNSLCKRQTRQVFRNLASHQQHLLLACAALVIVGLLAFGWINRYFLTSEDGTWQRIQQSGVWRVGMDPSFPPFDLLDGAGQPTGFDVELAQAIAARWGAQVQIVAIGFDGLTDALLAGKVDSVVSALPYDPRLTEDLRYSSSYFEAGVRLAVGKESPIRGVDDLAGKRLAVEWGSAGDAAARKLQRGDPPLQRLTFPSPQAAVEAMLNGAADGVLVDGVTLRQMQGEGADLLAVGAALESNPYVIALPLAAYTLHEEIESALTDFVTTGFLNALENRWFSE
ncbi:MAG: amino acid ABC transporter substrate-binding protein [Chloroflexi bacterium]|nr:MAG: amino acid ABC transporter substrate-binding protein [Chloroflexota bacterium]